MWKNNPKSEKGYYGHEKILRFFLIFADFSAQLSYKEVSYKKKNVYAYVMLKS